MTTDTIKLVKCLLRNNQGEEKIRYIPLEMYDMWKYMMEHKYNFEIRSQIVSVWMSAEEFNESTNLLFTYNAESVIEVVVIYTVDDFDILTHTVRFFSPEEYRQFKTEFLSHYGITGKDKEEERRRVRERPGFFLSRKSD